VVESAPLQRRSLAAIAPVSGLPPAEKDSQGPGGETFSSQEAEPLNLSKVK
jgi:hypothetical protein